MIITFQEYSDLRNHIESSYWYQAVAQLTSDDHEHIAACWSHWRRQKLKGNPIQIPQPEHQASCTCVFIAD